MGTPTNVKVGAGTLYFGVVGAVEPSDLTAPISTTVWTAVGYTDKGHLFSVKPSYETIEVAEEKMPVRREKSAVEYSVEFEVAEMTALNVQKALNGGTVTTAAGTVTFEPPAPTDPDTRVAILWESDAKDERWIFRKCIQTDKVDIERRKAPQKALIPMHFELEVVSSAIRPFRAIFPTPAP